MGSRAVLNVGGRLSFLCVHVCKTVPQPRTLWAGFTANLVRFFSILELFHNIFSSFGFSVECVQLLVDVYQLGISCIHPHPTHWDLFGSRPLAVTAPLFAC